MSDWLSPQFYIRDITISTVEGASCVNIGNNWPIDFKNYKKHNQGFGSVGGNQNRLSDARAYLYDPDVVDILGESATDEIPDWVRKMIVEKVETDR